MDTFLEGIEAGWQPCTLAVVLPAVAVAIASGRLAFVSWVGFLVGCAGLFWARAAGYWELDRLGLMQWVIALIVLVAFGALLRRYWLDLDLTFSAGLALGALAGWLWRPCVGERLGDILNNAGDEPVRTFLLTPIYVTGVTVVALALALVPIVVPALVRVVEHRAWRAVGAAFALAYAGLIAVGRYDDLVGELLLRSTA